MEKDEHSEGGENLGIERAVGKNKTVNGGGKKQGLEKTQNH